MRSIRMLKTLARGPVVVLSTVLTSMVGALLPAPVGLALFVVGLVIAGVLAMGRLEPRALRVQIGARPPAQWEAAVLAPAVTLLNRQGIGPPVVTLYMRDRGGVGAWAAGRRGVIVSTGLVCAVQLQQLRPEEAAALMTHAAALLQVGRPRFDLLIEFWTLPWQVLIVMATAVGRGFAVLPLVEFAWKVRFVVATIAVVQSVAEHRAASGAVIAVFIALTYLVPRWRRAWLQQVEAAADGFVVDNGLGTAWAAFLGRQSTSPAMLRRIDRITGLTQGPALRLVEVS